MIPRNNVNRSHRLFVTVRGSVKAIDNLWRTFCPSANAITLERCMYR